MRHAGPAGARDQAVRRPLHRRERREEVQGQDQDREGVEQRARDDLADAEDAAERFLRQRRVLDVVLGLLDVVVTVVEVVQRPRLLQQVEPVGGVPDQAVDLVGDDRDDREADAGDREDHQQEHHADRQTAPQAAAHEPLDQRVQADGDEHRDQQQDQHRAGLAERVPQSPGDQYAEGREEPEHERVRPPQRRTGQPHADVRVPLLDQQLLGEVVLLRMLSPVGSLLRVLLGLVRVLLGLVGFVRRLVRLPRSLPSLTSRLVRRPAATVASSAESSALPAATVASSAESSALPAASCRFVGGVLGLVG